MSEGLRRIGAEVGLCADSTSAYSALDGEARLGQIAIISYILN